MRLVIVKFLCVLVLGTILAACSTRQVSDSVSGSTAQRLATYSLEKFVRELVEQPEMEMPDGQAVQLSVHFIDNHPLLDYAEALLRYELESRYQVSWAAAPDSSLVEIDVYFNSIGTDHDNFGLSLPSFGLAGVTSDRISILAVDMFHGVTEGYALIKDSERNTLARSKKMLARVRADSVATPFVIFPVNQLD